MHRGLFVPDEDVAQIVLLEECIVDRQDRAAGVAENPVDPLVRQSADNHLRAGHPPVRHFPTRHFLIRHALGILSSWVAAAALRPAEAGKATTAAKVARVPAFQFLTISPARKLAMRSTLSRGFSRDFLQICDDFAAQIV